MSAAPIPAAPSPGSAADLLQRRTWRRFDTGYRMRPPVTVGLIAAVTLGHLGSGLLDGRLGKADAWGLFGVRSLEALERCGGRVAYLVDRGEVWRLWTYAFLHADALHFTLNTVALVGLGRVTEAVYGSTRTLWLFLFTAITGGLASQLGGNPASVGASGSLFGMMGALLLFGRRHRRAMDGDMRDAFGRRLAPWVVFNLALGLFLPSIDNLAHIGGLLGGAGFGLVSGNALTTNADASPLSIRAMRLVSAVLLAVGLLGVVEEVRGAPTRRGTGGP